mmetsp:Transcript_29372/g.63275  ORF Transcript_29372/g.63275 Transcript_29372/m.63275 type:complete len:265 (+) Transcript_29372:2-796(+)
MLPACVGIESVEQRELQCGGHAQAQARRGHGHLPPVLLHKPLADEQPQARPAPALQRAHIELEAFLADVQNLLLRQARARVHHGDTHRPGARVGQQAALLLGQGYAHLLRHAAPHPLHSHGHCSQCVGELEGVGQQVAQHLPQPGPVPDQLVARVQLQAAAQPPLQPLRTALRSKATAVAHLSLLCLILRDRPQREGDVLVPGLQQEGSHGPLQHLAHSHEGELQHEDARLHLIEVQQIIEHYDCLLGARRHVSGDALQSVDLL